MEICKWTILAGIVLGFGACRDVGYPKPVKFAKETRATLAKRMTVKGEPDINFLTTDLNYLCAAIDAHAGGTARGRLKSIRTEIELKSAEVLKVAVRYQEQIFKKLELEDLQKDHDRLLRDPPVDPEKLKKLKADLQAAEAEVLDHSLCEKQTRAIGEQMLKELDRWIGEL